MVQCYGDDRPVLTIVVWNPDAGEYQGFVNGRCVFTGDDEADAQEAVDRVVRTIQTVASAYPPDTTK